MRKNIQIGYSQTWGHSKMKNILFQLLRESREDVSRESRDDVSRE